MVRWKEVCRWWSGCAVERVQVEEVGCAMRNIYQAGAREAVAGRRESEGAAGSCFHSFTALLRRLRSQNYVMPCSHDCQKLIHRLFDWYDTVAGWFR